MLVKTVGSLRIGLLTCGPQLNLYNAESSIFVPLLLKVDLNIEWWWRRKYGMLEVSADFMSKKAQFQHVKINVNTVKLIQSKCPNYF